MKVKIHFRDFTINITSLQLHFVGSGCHCQLGRPSSALHIKHSSPPDHQHQQPLLSKSSIVPSLSRCLQTPLAQPSRHSSIHPSDRPSTQTSTMELSLLSRFLALVTIVSAFTLPIDETLMAADNETTLMARDDPVANIGILFAGLIRASTGLGDPCGHNRISPGLQRTCTDTKFSPSCQRLYDALNAYASDTTSKDHGVRRQSCLPLPTQSYTTDRRNPTAGEMRIPSSSFLVPISFPIPQCHSTSN